MTSTVATGLKVNPILGGTVSASNSAGSSGMIVSNENADYQSSPRDIGRLQRRIGMYRNHNNVANQHFETTSDLIAAEHQKQTMLLKQRHSESKTKKPNKKSESKKVDSSLTIGVPKNARSHLEVNSTCEENEPVIKKQKLNNSCVESVANDTQLADFHITQEIRNMQRNAATSECPITNSSSIPTEPLNKTSVVGKHSDMMKEESFPSPTADVLEDYKSLRQFTDQNSISSYSASNELDQLLRDEVPDEEDLQSLLDHSPDILSLGSILSSGFLNHPHNSVAKDTDPVTTYTQNSSSLYPAQSNYCPKPTQYHNYQIRPNIANNQGDMIPASQTLKQMAEQHQTNLPHQIIKSSTEFYNQGLRPLGTNVHSPNMFYNNAQPNLSPNVCMEHERSKVMQQSQQSSHHTNRQIPTFGAQNIQSPTGEYQNKSPADVSSNCESRPNSRSMQNIVPNGQHTPCSSGSPIGQTSLSSPVTPQSTSQNHTPPVSQHLFTQSNLPPTHSPNPQVSKLSPYPGMQQSPNFPQVVPGNSSNSQQYGITNTIRGSYSVAQRGQSPMSANGPNMGNIPNSGQTNYAQMMGAGVMVRPQLVNQNGQIIRAPPPDYRQAAMMQQMGSINPGMNYQNMRSSFRPAASSMTMQNQLMRNQSGPANMVNMKGSPMDQSMMPNMVSQNIPMMGHPNMMQRGRVRGPGRGMQNHMPNHMNPEYRQMMVQAKVMPNPGMQYQGSNMGPDPQMMHMQRGPNQMLMTMQNSALPNNNQINSGIQQMRLNQPGQGPDQSNQMNMQMGMPNAQQNMMMKSQLPMNRQPLINANINPHANATMQPHNTISGTLCTNQPPIHQNPRSPMGQNLSPNPRPLSNPSSLGTRTMLNTNIMNPSGNISEVKTEPSDIYSARDFQTLL